MKKRLLALVFSCFSILLLQGQDDVHIIDLKVPDIVVDKWEFGCLEVIDARRDTFNMGFVQTGAYKNPLPTQLRGGLKTSIERYLEQMLLQAAPDQPQFVFIFHEIQIIEFKENSRQRGYCKVELELARKENNQLYSLGIFEADAKNPNKMDATKSHGKRIRKAIMECLKLFDKTDWKNNQGGLIQPEALSYTYDFRKLPPRGLYRSYCELARHQPIEQGIEFEVDKVTTSKKYDDEYYLILENKKLAEKIRYFSDGQTVYMYSGRLANKPVFLKAALHGRYWGFITRTAPNARMVGMYGLLGTIVSTGNRGITAYFDTQTKQFREFSEYKIVKMTKTEHPEIFKAYKKSKRKLKDRAEVIRKLNEIYALSEEENMEND